MFITILEPLFTIEIQLTQIMVEGILELIVEQKVIYSRAMIEKLTEMAVESQQAGKLVMSPELQKLINANG